MCAWQSRSKALGGVPNISFIFIKLEPLGKIMQHLLYFTILKYGPIKLHSYYILILLSIIGAEFKTTACPVFGVRHHMEIQCGKEGMKAAKFNNTVGDMLAVVLDRLQSQCAGGVNYM
jgi:hypothetical protein